MSLVVETELNLSIHITVDMRSHHSHSGDYVAHGVDPLDDITARAIEMGFQTYCLTEHMPRIHKKFLYPEEMIDEFGTIMSLDTLQCNFIDFMDHAEEIKDRAKSNGCGTKFIIGSEIEGCDETHIKYAKELMDKYNSVLKFAVGSVHHVNEHPIDFDQASWIQALESSNNNIRKFLEDYYNLQYKMLTSVQPLVVGHFDIYKFYLPNDLKINKDNGVVVQDEYADGVLEKDIILELQWDSVKSLIVRNLEFIKSYGGLIEINTSGLRKKLPEPYPGNAICKLVKEHCDSRFVLSDDAHAVSQVGAFYKEVKKYITKTAKLDKLYYLEESDDGELSVKSESTDELFQNKFWLNL